MLFGKDVNSALLLAILHGALLPWKTSQIERNNSLLAVVVKG
jgi:hypothetical protein